MNTNLILVVAIATAGLCAACTRAVEYKESSPQPAVVTNDDGQRTYHPSSGEALALTYDESLDVYVVSGHVNTYYSAGQFLRYVAGYWEWSTNVTSGWKVMARTSDVPPGLRMKHGNGKK